MSMMLLYAVVVAPLNIGTFLSGIPAGYLALFGTIFGGVGLKIVEKWLGRNSEKQGERRDLNAEVNDLVKRVDGLEREVTFWRNRFYEEQEDASLLRMKMIEGGLTPPLKRVVPPSEFDGKQ